MFAEPVDWIIGLSVKELIGVALIAGLAVIGWKFFSIKVVNLLK